MTTAPHADLMKWAVDFAVKHGLDSEDVPRLHELLLTVRRAALNDAKRSIAALIKEQGGVQ